MTSQPVAAREVAEALVDLVEAGPSGRVPDLAGPEVLAMHRPGAPGLAGARAGRRVVAVPVPGRPGAGCATGR